VKLDRKVMAYAAGAVAASMACAESADAAIVASPGFNFGIDSANKINFDNSGKEEFNFGHERAKTTPVPPATVGDPIPTTDRLILKEPENGAMGEGYVVNFDNNNFPTPLAAGTLIGPDSTFDNKFFNNASNQIADEDFDNNTVRDDPLVTNFSVDDVVGNTQYIGVRFKVNDAGEDHYGWIGVDITNSDDLTGRVTGYAYNDVAGEGIDAGAVPEPAGLALLAIGAAGLIRRKRV
jgi:PEP-CTERM motif-containing protein